MMEAITKMGEKKLSNLDLNRLLASGSKVAVASAQVQLEHLTGVVNHQAAEIAFLKSQMAMAEANRLAQQRKELADASRKESQREHTELNTELGKKYGIDWQSSGFCPMTGEIKPLEEASLLGDDA